jgi:outer membrane protein TolC
LKDPNKEKTMLKKIIFCLAVVFVSGVSSGEAFAQGETSPGGTLSLERARELALLNSRSLARYNLDIQSNMLNTKTQNYVYLPSISLGASVSTELWTKDGITKEFSNDNVRAGASLSITETIPLWEGGKNSVLRAINSLNTEITRQNALAEYFAVLGAIDSAYYSVLEATAALEASEGSLGTAVLSLSMAEIRHESGMISDASYLQALSDKANRETSRNQSRRDLAVAKLRLKDLLGIDEVPVLEPVDFDSREELILLLSGLDDSGYDRLFAAFWKKVQAGNPSLINAALGSEISEKNLDSARWNYSPTLSASLSAGLNYSANNGLEPRPGEVSIRASIPLNFWDTAANVEKQKIARDRAALSFSGALGSLDMELRTALLDLISQAGQILSSRRALDYAQRHFDYVLELYRLSRNSPSELSDAETMVRNSRNQLSRSQYSFLNGLSKIRSMGTFNSEEEIVSLMRSVN